MFGKRQRWAAAALASLHSLRIAGAQDDEAASPARDTVPGSREVAPGTEPAEAPRVVPPKLRIQTPAQYPRNASANASGTVVLLVTISETGAVTSLEVASSLAPEFDGAAMAAVAQWEFDPALRDGVPVAVRINVPVSFSAPEVTAEVPSAAVEAPTSELRPEGAAGAETAPNQTARNEPPSEPGLRETPHTADAESTLPATEVTVAGQRYPADALRSASDFALKHDVLDAAPHHEGVDVLRATPGLYIGRPEGAAVAHRYMLRGFDSDHGQDIEFRVGGVPINLPSHIHGQGYADLGLLIGNTVSELRVTEGVHDPRQGDFAVAGSIDVRLGVNERGVKIRSGYGAFGTFEQLVLWAPLDALPDTFGAVEVQTTDGFGQNRAGERANVTLQQGFTWLDWRVRLLGLFHGARANMAGTLRRDDLDAGRVGFYDVYPHPTAQAQNATNLRSIVGVFGEYQGLLGDTAELGLWTSVDRFRVQQNWTGFLERSSTLANVAGRGDLIEQRNQTDTLGLTARYRTEARDIGPLHTHLSVGGSARLDTIAQQQNLLDAGVNSQTWDQRVDATIDATDIGAWVDVDLHWHDWVKVRLGYRGDVLGYEVDDKLGNRAPATRGTESYIVGFRRSAMGLAHGPRVSADVEPWKQLTFHASYGEGFRSPQARTLADGETAPFSKVRSADLGTRLELVEGTHLTVSAYHTHLSDDVVFEASEGRLERVGATQRRGGVAYLETRPVAGVVGAFSVTYVDAELLEPPPATAEEPNPPFKPGQRLPFVPPLVARADVGAERELAQWLNQPVTGRLGLGMSALSSRPLPYGYTGQPFALLDTSAGLGLGPAMLTLSIYNLLDMQYPAAEYSFASSWHPDAPSSRLPVRHIVAGSPRTWMVSLEVDL